MRYADKVEYSNIQIYEIGDMQIENLVLKAIRAGVGTIVVGPSALPVVNKMLRPEDNITVDVALSYPSGAYLPFQKVQEIEGMLELDEHYDEFYVVMSVGQYLSGHVEEMKEELKSIVSAAKHVPVKIVTEISAFTKVQMQEVCDAAAEAGVKGMVISADFKPYDIPLATKEQIKDFVEAAAGRFDIIGAGGVTSVERFQEMLDAGVTKVNTADAYEILAKLQ